MEEEEEEGPLSPSLLEEEEVLVVSESEDEEVVPATPPRPVEQEEFQTSPVIQSQRRRVSRRTTPPLPPLRNAINNSQDSASQEASIVGEVEAGAPSAAALGASAVPLDPPVDAIEEASAEPPARASEAVAKAPTEAVAEAAVEASEKPRKKRKRRSEEEEEGNEEGSCCTICFERWANSGSHRIASLKCGHFFGLACIEKWLRGGSSCPNCNEKATKRDIRVHYVARLAALDTGERDRALAELEKTRVTLREAQLRETELQVRLQQQQELIEKLRGGGEGERGSSRGGQGGSRGGQAPPAFSLVQQKEVEKRSGEARLVYQRRHELCKASPDRDKCCRVLAHSAFHGMLLVSQPNTASGNLFPGFGVRRFNMLEQKVGNYVPVVKDVLRDLSLHPTQHELLLSCGQDKTARITNISSCTEVARFSSDNEVWACDWGPGGLVYLGTKRSTLEVRDTRDPGAAPQELQFQGTERRPIIGLRAVAAKPEAGLPYSGVLLLTLGSLWYWEMQDGFQVQHRLATPPGRLFSSLDYHRDSGLVLVNCRPQPLALHLVIQLAAVGLPGGARTVTGQVVMSVPGGSYRERSFLRAAIVSGSREGQVLLVYGRGTGVTDTRLVVKEVGSERTLQEVVVGKPVLDIQDGEINGVRYLAALGETELTMYKWE